MRFLTTHLLAAAFVASAFFALAIGDVARAEEGEASAKVKPATASKTAGKDYVAKLSTEELAFLTKRVTDWKTLDAGKKQRIARNVVRMRFMTDTERKRLRDHIKRLPPKRDGSTGHSGKRKRFRDHATRALLNRALARDARKQLGRDFGRRLQGQEISDHAFEESFARVFWSKVGSRRAAAGDPVAPSALPADFPARWRSHYSDIYAKWAALPSDSKERARFARGLHYKLVMHQGEKFRAKLVKTDLKGDAYVAAVGTAVRKQWPEAFAETLQDPDALVRAADKFELRRSIQRIARRNGRLERDESGLLVSMLNRLALHHRKGDTQAQQMDDAVLKQVLVRELRVPASAVKDLPPPSKSEARAAFFRKLFAGRRMPGFGRAPGRRGSKDGGKGRRGVPPKLERPTGVSDDDWTAWLKYRTVLQAAMAENDMAALKLLRGAQPAAMSDEGYELVRAAFRAKFGQRGERAPGGPRRR